MQIINRLSNKKSIVIPDRLPKNNYGAWIITKIKNHQRVISSNDIWKIWKIVVIKNKKNWKAEIIRDVWTCSGSLESTKLDQVIIWEKTRAFGGINASKNEGSPSWEW